MTMLTLGDTGQHQVVSGYVLASGPTLTCSDDSASVASGSTGVFTVTFGQPFLSAPIVTANIVDATDATTAAHSVAVQSSSTTTIVFNVKTATTNGTATDILSALADVDFNFIAMGKRNR